MRLERAIGSAIFAMLLSPSFVNAGQPTAVELLNLTKSCRQVSVGRFPIDKGTRPTVPICKLNGAIFWKADMDIDCDGQRTIQCNEQTDPMFSPDTSVTDSKGNFLDSARLPWVTIPEKSSKFNFQRAGVSFGSVVAVIYNGNVSYGVFGDENGDRIIGEASYAMATSLGINPDPSEGGVDPQSVTYIAFTGPTSIVRPIENRALAVKKGQQLATKLLRH